MSVEDKVKKIVSDQLGTAIDDIKSDSSFVDDLGADSLDTVELVMALSLIHISEPTRLLSTSYAAFCLKKKKNTTHNTSIHIIVILTNDINHSTA